MSANRRDVLKIASIGTGMVLTGCSAFPSNTAVVQVEYDDCWRGHFGAKTSDGRDIVVRLTGDGREREDTTGFGSEVGGAWLVTIPDDISRVDELQPPLVATSTIDNHVTCAGGDARDWSDGPLSLTLEYNGEAVGSETVRGKGTEARVEYTP